MAIKDGIGGVIKETSSIKSGIGGVIKTPSAGYCGINGVVRQYWPAEKTITSIGMDIWRIAWGTRAADGTLSSTTNLAISQNPQTTGTTFYSPYGDVKFTDNSWEVAANPGYLLQFYGRLYVLFSDGSVKHIVDYLNEGHTFSMVVNYTYYNPTGSGSGGTTCYALGNLLTGAWDTGADTTITELGSWNKSWCFLRSSVAPTSTNTMATRQTFKSIALDGVVYPTKAIYDNT